jgi:hypothetical protein
MTTKRANQSDQTVKQINIYLKIKISGNRNKYHLKKKTGFNTKRYFHDIIIQATQYPANVVIKFCHRFEFEN